MKFLESKIPPPLILLIIACLMWLVSAWGFSIAFNEPLKTILILLFFILSMVFSFGGIISFKRAATTINPLSPHLASSLVNTGIYRLTRNPMYLGMLCLLIAWAIHLSNFWVFCCLPLFIVYIHYYQILPEERALHIIFKEEFTEYKSSVRRWI